MFITETSSSTGDDTAQEAAVPNDVAMSNTQTLPSTQSDGEAEGNGHRHESTPRPKTEPLRPAEPDKRLTPPGSPKADPSVNGKPKPQTTSVRGRPRSGLLKTITPRGITELPVVFIHGDLHTREVWTSKPDSGAGWAQYFFRAGRIVHLVDLSWNKPPDWKEANSQSLFPLTVQNELTDPSGRPRNPHCAYDEIARNHTRWPGTGREGDPVFDACLKSRVRALHDTTHRQATGQQTVADVLEKKGKAFIIAEGTGCQIAWLAADIRPELVAGIIAVEPAGPPFGESGVKDRNNHQRWLWSPRYRQDVRRYGLTDIPLSYDPPLPPPVNILDEPNGRPKLNLQAVLSPEPGDCKGQRIFLQADCSVPGPLVGVKATDASPVRTLFQLQKVPHVVITAPASSHALYDHATVAFMRQAGLDVTWERLGERGIHGNGNLMFLETNSDEIAKLIEGHLHRLTPPHAPISNGVETQVDGSSQKQ